MNCPKLAGVNPADGAVLWEQPIAAFRLAQFAYPVNAYLQSVKDDDHAHPETSRAESFVAVYRKNYEVWRLDLSKPAYRFLRSLAKGRPFGKAVAEAARAHQGDAGDLAITGADDCSLVGYDGTPDGVTIEVLNGAFQVANGPLPEVFNAPDPDNPDIGDSEFAWSAIDGRAAPMMSHWPLRMTSTMVSVRSSRRSTPSRPTSSIERRCFTT